MPPRITSGGLDGCGWFEGGGWRIRARRPAMYLISSRIGELADENSFVAFVLSLLLCRGGVNAVATSCGEDSDKATSVIIAQSK